MTLGSRSLVGIRRLFGVGMIRCWAWQAKNSTRAGHILFTENFVSDILIVVEGRIMSDILVLSLSIVQSLFGVVF